MLSKWAKVWKKKRKTTLVLLSTWATTDLFCGCCERFQARHVPGKLIFNIFQPKIAQKVGIFCSPDLHPWKLTSWSQKMLIFIYCRCFSFWKTGHLQVPAVCFWGCFPSKNARWLLYHFYTVVRCRHTTGHVKVNFPHGRCKIPPAKVLWFLGEFLTWKKMLPSLNLTYSLKMGRSPKGKETCDTTCDRIIGMVVGLFFEECDSRMKHSSDFRRVVNTFFRSNLSGRQRVISYHVDWYWINCDHHFARICMKRSNNLHTFDARNAAPPGMCVKPCK